MSRLKRMLALMMMTLTIVVVPTLAAWAQEGEIVGEEGSQPVNALVTVSFISIIVALIIERIRKRAPGLDGDLITFFALVLGYASAWVWKLDVAASFGWEGLPVPLSYLVAAGAIAGVSGIIGTAKGAIASRDPNSDVPAPNEPTPDA